MFKKKNLLRYTILKFHSKLYGVIKNISIAHRLHNSKTKLYNVLLPLFVVNFMSSGAFESIAILSVNKNDCFIFFFNDLKKHFENKQKR